MRWPSDSPRARLVRVWRWRLAKLREELKAWLDHVWELDREQRRVLHERIRSFLS